jgi:hypothetical protein
MLLCRDVQFEFGGVPQDELVSRLITEIKRSTLLFRQNFPNLQIGQVLFSGAGDFLGSLANRAKDEIGIETSVIRFEELLDRSAFRGEWDEFRFHLPSFSAAIGAAWRKAPGAGINLLPGKTSGATKKTSATSIARIAAVLVLILTAAVAFHYYRAVTQLAAERAALQQRNAVAEPLAVRADAVERQRQMASSIATYVAQTGGGEWTEIFRSLTFVIPESAVLESVRAEPAAAPAPRTLTVKGTLLAPTAQQANADFNRFFNGLRGLRHFSTVALSRPLTVVNESVTGTPESAASFQSRVGFEVKCQLAPKT